MIVPVVNQNELAACYLLMSKLRPGLTTVEFHEGYERQKACGYEIFLFIKEGEAVGLVGFTISFCFSAKMHLYLYDFIVDPQHERNGVGAKLIEWLIAYARIRDCRSLHVDVSLERNGASEFFHKQGAIMSARHFSIQI